MEGNEKCSVEELKRKLPGSSGEVWVRRFLPTTFSTGLVFFGELWLWQLEHEASCHCVMCPTIPSASVAVSIPAVAAFLRVSSMEGRLSAFFTFISPALGHWIPGLLVWLRQSTSHFISTFSARVPRVWFHLPGLQNEDDAEKSHSWLW